MQTLFLNLLSVLVWIIFIYLSMGCLYFLIFSFGSLFHRQKKGGSSKEYRRIAVFIPGYKEDSVIVDVAREGTNQTYPSKYFDVIVLADSFSENTLNALRDLPIKVLEMKFEKSTKANSLNKAMSILGNNYNIAVVLDADNIMEPAFLEKVHIAFDNGYTAVQGHRTAKNKNTAFAMLDAVSEEINNQIFRAGHRALGMSSALIGSAMAFDYTLYRESMAGIDSVGEDKMLEFVLLKKNCKIEYLPEAWVYDEKVQRSEDFVQQRRRWLASKFHNIGFYMIEGIKQLFKGNIDYFDKVLQKLLPPTSFQLAGSMFATFIIFVVWLFAAPSWGIEVWLYRWLSVFAGSVIAVFIAIPRRLYTKELLKAVLSLPKAIAMMFLALIKVKGASRKFIHTPHGIQDKS